MPDGSTGPNPFELNDSVTNDPAIIERLNYLNNREYSLDESPRLVASYQTFQRELNPQTNLVYYPASGADISASKGFPNSRVIYVDIEPKTVAALKKAGYEAYEQSALEYRPENPVDILILQNPSIPPDVPSQYVAEGGYVLCNDYHATATDLRGNQDFELVGIIKKQGDQGDSNYVLDRENPDDYWKSVELDEELKRMDVRTYEQVAEHVQKIFGVDQNITQEYRKLLYLIRDKPDQAEELLISKLGVSSVFFLGGSEVVMMYPDGRSSILPSLPRKKGHMDDTFVFKKRQKQNEAA